MTTTKSKRSKITDKEASMDNCDLDNSEDSPDVGLAIGDRMRP
jgi:hypothetical protein